jgi:hypothetical protein
MAVRKTNWHPDRVRERIQTSQLVNRLRDHALGKTNMSATQVRAAEILLRKTVPDLTSMEFSGEVGVRNDVSDEPMSVDEWNKRYADSLETPARSAESTH